jgi:2,3-bisphosphoglycerate-independent phosphoglycerate mutase
VAGGPVALVVLDGWGCEAAGPGNAVALADTPVFDRLRARFPHATLEASGRAVGLPDGQMGNSEVGHLTIGAGRVIYQDLVRVNNAIDDGSFFESEALNAAFERAQTRDASVHLLGLVSYGGVHSHIDHIRALAELARRHGLERSTHVHAFTDGRDVSPAAAVDDVAEFVTEGISVATVCGRYWAMDRDRRWERIDAALEVILGRGGATLVDPLEAIRASYAAGITDEFIEPVAVGGTPRLAEGDVGIFANFRPDRARQLSERLVQAGVDLTTMTRYSSELDCPVVFEEQDVDGTLAEVVSRAQLRQLHVAETEKYAHVTYFLNGGREEPWAGEERELVPSPTDVATYDLRPEMSAAAVARAFAERVADVELSVVNFANPDMVGHTGVLPAVVRAVEEVDRCLGIVLEAVERAGGVALVFADHGNAERMLDTDCASPHTAHTTNPVPVIITRDGAELRADGTLADIAPTALGLLDLIPPAAMSGRSLLAAG